MDFSDNNLTIIKVDREYFDAEETLECGQIFRFKRLLDGYLAHSKDKACFIRSSGDLTEIYCYNEDKDYFTEYFDLANDYSSIVSRAKMTDCAILCKAAELGKGVRILKQNETEMLFSFIVSQNNHIPRIKSIIERMSMALGEKKSFCGEEYYAFPEVQRLAEKDGEYYFSLGLGYRAEYISRVAKSIVSGEFDINKAKTLSTEELKKELLTLYGVGPKVCDCVSLFGFNRLDSFPVDTWIEKIYKEDFKGGLTDRKKMAKWFVDRFGADSGYFQQYLFYYKRSLEKLEEPQNSI